MLILFHNSKFIIHSSTFFKPITWAGCMQRHRCLGPDESGLSLELISAIKIIIQVDRLKVEG